MGRVTTSKLKFQRGNITINFKEEERVYLLSLFKGASPKTDLEKRIVHRAILRLLGYSCYNVPLRPPKECRYCEEEIRGDRHEAHELACKLKREQQRMIPKIDPAVLEMVRAGL